MAYSPVILSKVATDGADGPQSRPAFCLGSRGDQHRYTFPPVRDPWSQSVITLLTWGYSIGYVFLPKQLRCVKITFCYRQKAESDTVRLDVINVAVTGGPAGPAVT